jgi:hypothetical protein
MDISNNIYGNIKNNQEIIISIGNYNNIFGLLSNMDGSLKVNNLTEINEIADTRKIIRFILIYENLKTHDKKLNNPLDYSINPKDLLNNHLKDYSINPKDLLKFSLKINDDGGDDKYLNIKINNKNKAIATISSKKAIFWVDYSTIDNVNSARTNLLAGSLYLLATYNNNIKYNIQWPINNDLNSELVIFLPTQWYEKNINNCQLNNGGYIQLIDKLKQLSFKGYNTKKWCEEVDYIYNCDINTKCGDCMGMCDTNKICQPDFINNKFKCVDHRKNNKDLDVSFINKDNKDNIITTKDTSNNNGIYIILIIIIIIFIFSIILYIEKISDV